MDVNGTRFHLIRDEADWQVCREELAPGAPARVAYNRAQGALTLRALLPLYRPDRPGAPLRPANRRGATLDRYGNHYWIGADERSIWWGGPKGDRPSLYWRWAPQACPAPAAAFAPIDTPEQQPDRLAGLTVTEHHYLVAGSVGRGGLYLFDLHAGPDPMLITFPAGIPFTPFDLAPAPGGGLWALDRANRSYWGFDRHFKVLGMPGALVTITPAVAHDFRPIGGQTVVRPPRRFPSGFPLAAVQPLAIEALPDGSVLVLDQASTGAASLWRYRLDELLGGPVELADELAFDLGAGMAAGRVELAAHDIAFLPAPGQGDGDGILYASEDNGHQVIAFELRYGPDELSLRARSDYLPLHAHGGRALVADYCARPPQVRYDLVAAADRSRDLAVRWVTLQQVEQPRYASAAALVLDMAGSAPDEPAALDGKTPGCVWHRLFIDGCLPPESTVEVQTRAADSRDELEVAGFRSEPPLYLRASGSEIPYHQAFAEGDDPTCGRGTWELLFQAVRGRYLQVRLVLRGNGRVSPRLYALRAYYPRLSYVRRFLPPVYSDDPVSADFTERMLANHEGFFSELEGKIALVGSLFDARSAPPEALDWLAGWWGLLLDPLWSQLQQRRAGPDAPDRRRLFIRFARRLYERRGTPDGMRFALMLLLDPCLEALLARLKAAALRPNATLRSELAAANLPYPTPATSELELEDLLYAYLLTPRRPSQIRIVERYQTRNGRALAAGDPSSGDDQADVAHRFTVLVPEGLDPTLAAMVGRVVELERPAHTSFEVRRYFDLFRVGEARLGLESVLGAESRFAMLALDRGSYLAGGYLAPAAPQATPERIIVGRDRAGTLPAL